MRSGKVRDMDSHPIDPMMLIIYTTRRGLRMEKETTVSKLHAEIDKIQKRGGWSIKVL